MSTRSHTCARVAVVLSFLLLLAWQFQESTQKRDDQGFADSAEDRNEQSTPRSFVLPATPMVAIMNEQEAQAGADVVAMRRCIQALHAAGYAIEQLDTRFNAELIEAVYRFQHQFRLAETGVLDAVTKEKLGCL